MRTEEQKAKQRVAAANWRARNVEKARAASRKCYHDGDYKNRYKDQLCGWSKASRDGDGDWRKSHPLQYAINRARYRAKTHNMEFDITIDDFDTVPTHCPVLGVELVAVSRNAEEKERVMSIDRIDPNKGYIKDNVTIISWKANRMKNALTIDLMKKFIAVYEGATK